MKIKQMKDAMLLLLTLILNSGQPAYALSEPSDLQIKVEKLVKVLEAKRQEFHIPGMAIAVVKDDKIIMSQGFGVMDLENNKPVTEKTLFSIGSSSKAFTSTMVAMFVDQDKLAWDDLVTEKLPQYEFSVDDKTLPITYRDMLSHRTGYTRNDLLWANGQASRDLILKTAVKAEPVDEFQKNFYYNNVMYLAAGEAMAQVAGKSWNVLLNEMILKPLNMNDTTSVHEKAEAQENISLGYQWNEETGQHDLMPRRNLNNIAPAGGIYSNVNDMAQWVRFQLNQGAVDGSQKHLISAEQIAATYEPQIKIANGVDYGMGWMLRSWHHKKVIEHGGNIDGYAAQVAMIPEANLGFVLLTNLTATPLQQASINLVFEHLLVDENIQSSGESAELDYQEFVGKYHADFGPFKDVMFTFLVREDGKPAVDVPGQMVYELKDPNEEGLWYFALTDTISISFDRSQDDNVIAMRMQQNGANFELPKAGYEISPEVAAGTFDEYLGSYESKKLKGTIKAVIKNHRLAMDVPNQLVFELHLPDENGFRDFRIKSDTSVKFIKNESGEVTAVELYKNKEELVETVPKIESASKSQLASIDDINKLRKAQTQGEVLKNKSGFIMAGEIKVKSSGVTGQVVTKFDHKGNYKQTLDFGVFGQIITTVNQNQGSSYGISPYVELQGKYLKQAQREHPLVNIDWHSFYDSMKVVGSSKIKEKKVYEVRLKQQGLPAVTVFIDQDNGDINKMQTQVLMPSMGSVGVETYYADYRDEHGLRIPFKVTVINPMMGEAVIQYESFKAEQKFSKNEFDTSKPRD